MKSNVKGSDVVLSEKDYVIVKPDGQLLSFADGQIIVYGSLTECESDLQEGEKVVRTTELPKNLTEELKANIIKFES